jgi:hypothetical protein
VIAWKIASSAVDVVQGFEQNVVRHPLDEITAGACLESLIDIFITFISRENDEFCIRRKYTDLTYGLNATHIG